MAICEKERTDITTNVVIAANRLTEAKKVCLGSTEHELAMIDLLDQLCRPGGLEVLLRVVPEVKSQNGRK